MAEGCTPMQVLRGIDKSTSVEPLPGIQSQQFPARDSGALLRMASRLHHRIQGRHQALRGGFGPFPGGEVKCSWDDGTIAEDPKKSGVYLAMREDLC